MKEDKEVQSYTSPLAASQGAEGGEGSPQPTEEQMNQAKEYTNVVLNMIHNPKTRDATMKILESGNGDVYTSVPEAAVAANDMAMNLMEQSGAAPQPGIQLAAAASLISDLIELGVAKGLWEMPDEEGIKAITEDTIQIVIERGLKDGSIDPIQLQLEVEPLMDKDQRAGGQAMADEAGLEGKPSQTAIMEQYASGRVRENESKLAKQATNKRQKQALQGAGGGQ